MYSRWLFVEQLRCLRFLLDEYITYIKLQDLRRWSGLFKGVLLPNEDESVSYNSFGCLVI